MPMQHRSPAMAGPTPVIALHCSGAGAGQWRQLAEVLGPGHHLTAPEHYGCDSAGPWRGSRAFTLADEASRTFELIDRSDRTVHLIGHSYGGGVALHVALARTGRIASLTLYEPSAFHLLRAMGERGTAAFAEISGVARAAEADVGAGDYAGAVAGFVDYWGGPGAWAGLRPSVQAALVRWVPKAPLDFHALMTEPSSLAAYAGLRMPVLILRGEHAPLPTRTIAELLPALMPAARLAVVAGAGHMGPLTHGPAVNALIAAHLYAVETAARQPRGRRASAAAGAQYHDLPSFAEGLS